MADSITKKSIFAIITALSLAIVGLAYSEGNKISLIAFLLSVASVFAAFFFEILSISETSKKGVDIAKSLKFDISDAIKNQAAVFYIGDHVSAFLELSDRFNRATTVENVYIPYALRRDIYYTLTKSERIANIEKFLSSPDKKYIEIISQDAYFSIGDIYLERIEASNKHKNFDFLVMNKSMPIINFVIFHYADGVIEVLFGWGGFESTAVTPVFSSKDPRLVSIFSQMFQTIRNISSYPSAPHSIVGRMKEYIGYWIDVSCGQDGKVENWAIVEFFLEGKTVGVGSDRRIALRGWAFKVTDNDKPTAELVRIFKSNSCEIKGTKIFCSHEAQSPVTTELENRSIGQSIYDFSNLEQTGFMYGQILSKRIPNFNDDFINTISIKSGVDLSKFLGDRHAGVKDFEKCLEECKPSIKSLVDNWKISRGIGPQQEERTIRN